ncbi:helix-turn-helix transcriptional regulator [Clostridium sp. HBUAS56017]|uniref:helix-turn-helix transcriptional regulator n=1 Tax=Clostridium sp. HBUAS56017 TaxID=2571128 RepID=UPI00163D8361|nr:helix-turn-helix transcriptional regulator [Clostridium sp. HBUAS56017]
MELMDKFREEMIKARKKNNLSKSDLARMISKSPSLICDIESKRKNPSLQTAVDIANILGLSLDKIFMRKLLLESKKGGHVC